MPTSCRICALLVPNFDKSGTQPETRKLQQVCCRLVACSHQADIRMRSHRLLRLDQASEFRSAIGKCRPDCRPILMLGRQKVADLNFALE